jgi:hypothetical protein
MAPLGVKPRSAKAEYSSRFGKVGRPAKARRQASATRGRTEELARVLTGELERPLQAATHHLTSAYGYRRSSSLAWRRSGSKK